MRPHMAHLHNTFIKRRLAEDAAKTSIDKYEALVEKARRGGFSDEEIIAELEAEKIRVQSDLRMGDANFLQGVRNAQRSCLASIDFVISQLKGDPK